MAFHGLKCDCLLLAELLQGKKKYFLLVGSAILAEYENSPFCSPILSLWQTQVVVANLLALANAE